jgi:hypothetical protein
MQNNMHDLDNLAIWERNGAFDHILKNDHHRTISATFWLTWMTCLDSSFLVKNIVCSDIHHFFPILQDCRDHACCQMAQVSKPIRLLLQIKISQKKNSQMNPCERLQAPGSL